MWNILDAEPGELLAVRRAAGEEAIAQVVSVDRSGDGCVTIRIEPGTAAYKRGDPVTYVGGPGSSPAAS